jgi:hypothetical protein
MLSEKLLLLRGDDEDHDVLTRGLITGPAPLAVALFSDSGRILTKTCYNVANRVKMYAAIEMSAYVQRYCLT